MTSRQGRHPLHINRARQKVHVQKELRADNDVRVKVNEIRKGIRHNLDEPLPTPKPSEFVANLGEMRDDCKEAEENRELILVNNVHQERNTITVKIDRQRCEDTNGGDFLAVVLVSEFHFLVIAILLFVEEMPSLTHHMRGEEDERSPSEVAIPHQRIRHKYHADRRPEVAAAIHIMIVRNLDIDVLVEHDLVVAAT